MSSTFDMTGIYINCNCNTFYTDKINKNIKTIFKEHTFEIKSKKTFDINNNLMILNR